MKQTQSSIQLIIIASIQKAKHSRYLGVYRDSAELKQVSRCSHCSKHCI